MDKLTKQWVVKAESDYRVVGQLTKSADFDADPICFHCQQSAEKYLKALL